MVRYYRFAIGAMQSQQRMVNYVNDITGAP